VIPSISVIVCAYNEEKYLDICLRSLLNQKISMPYEVILVDDASTDSTGVILTRYREHERVRVFTRQTNGGIGAAANEGVNQSQGRYVVRVDADDYVSEHFLQVLVLALADHESPRAARCDYLTVDASGNFLQRQNANAHPIACGILFDRDALLQIGNYDHALNLGEDTDLERRFSEHYEIAHIPIALYRYRQHDGNTSGGHS
jgi:glycosyltransferase involved in cell wall biosynthesis